MEEKNSGTENVMRKIEIEKIVLSIGTTENLEQGKKLLELISGMKPAERKSKKRIPELGVRPGLAVGCMVTVRKNKEALLKRLLGAIENKLKKKQIRNNHFSFGIEEYIEIPGMEYQRDIGTMGLRVTVVFARKGKRVTRKKIKRGRIPKKQDVSVDEIIEFLKNKFDVEVR